MTLLAVHLAAATPEADTPSPAQPPQVRESFARLYGEYQDAFTKYMNEQRAAFAEAKKRGRAAMNGFHFDKASPSVTYAPRFLGLVEQNPDDPDAAYALELAVYGCGPKLKPNEIRAKAIQLCRAHYVTKPEISKILKLMATLDDDAADLFLDDVIARNADRAIQAAALKAKIAKCQQLASFAKNMKAAALRASSESAMGKAWVTERIATSQKASARLPLLKKILRENYPDFDRELQIGSPAPEVITQDINGKQVRLSALKGKVVVLDFWATSSIASTVMIPQDRRIVARLKGKPFELVSISADDDLDAVKNFLANESMPWPQWFPGGPHAPFFESWNIEHIPMLFILDAKGIIRYKQVRGDELDNAVDTLVKEAEGKKE
jgi:peroxiredoxin